ncbi:hypothetical protein UlMin_004272 [Ulmus minor]
MNEKDANMMKKECFQKKYVSDEESKCQLLKQEFILFFMFSQELKNTLHTTKAGMQFMQMKFHEEFHNLGLHIHSLAYAISRYHRVLEENWKLYNQVQDLKGSIRIYCRVKPFLSGQPNYLSSMDHIEDGIITINTPSKHGKGCRSFNFNKVFGPSSIQAEIFSDMQPLIHSILDGYNVCIFAYGQTGSGKTFTMIEIYNEQVRNLLIRNSSQTGLSVPNTNLVPVSSTADVINLMNLGQRNRVVGATTLNDHMTRSHSCLTVHVQGRDLTSRTILRGCMHLVDLAGSERVDKFEVTGDRLKEAQHINKSLSTLGDVIASLAQRNPHVPYRNSKLTQFLHYSLGGQAKTLMFVHISPEPDAVSKTISTLKFADRVATVELGAAKVNKDTLGRKDEESEHNQLSLCRSSVKYRPKASELSPFPSKLQSADMLSDHNVCRQLLIERTQMHVTLTEKMLFSFGTRHNCFACINPPLFHTSIISISVYINGDEKMHETLLLALRSLGILKMLESASVEATLTTKQGNNVGFALKPTSFLMFRCWFLRKPMSFHFIG